MDKQQSGKLKSEPYASIITEKHCRGNFKVIKFNSNQPCFSCSDIPNGGKKNMENKNEKKTYQKQGNPYKRGNTWTYIYYVTDPATGGKKQKRKGGFLSRKAAESAMKETEALITVGRFVMDSKLTTGEYLTSWFEIYKQNLQPNTKNGYGVNIRNHILPNIGGIPLAKLNRHEIMAFNNKLIEDGLSATTVKYVNRVLSKALKEAVLSDLIYRNPCDNIPLPKQEKYNPTILNNDQIKLLLRSCIGTNVELEVLIALSMGPRRGEVVGIKFSDFDFSEKSIHIQRQVTVVKDTTVSNINKDEPVWGFKSLKTKKSNRVLSVPQAVLDAVNNRKTQTEKNKTLYGRQYEDNDLVCCQADGKIESPQTVYHRFKKLLEECGLPDIRFHDLRHSYATALIDLDVPLKVISDILGHSSVQTTGDIYCHALEEKRKQSAEIFQNAFFAK